MSDHSELLGIIENLEYIQSNIPAYIEKVKKAHPLKENIDYFIFASFDILKVKSLIENAIK